MSDHDLFRVEDLHAIMGANGSGKSTMASTRLASPEFEVTSGHIWFQSDDITDWPNNSSATATTRSGARTHLA